MVRFEASVRVLPEMGMTVRVAYMVSVAMMEIGIVNGAAMLEAGAVVVTESGMEVELMVISIVPMSV